MHSYQLILTLTYYLFDHLLHILGIAIYPFTLTNCLINIFKLIKKHMVVAAFSVH